MAKSHYDEVVRAIVQDAASALADSLPAALADEPDAVHQHRTAVRRLRSVLAGFRKALDAPAANRLRAQYGDWGRQLGVVRDAEVRAQVAADALRERGLDDDPAWRRLVDEEEAEYTRAHARLVELAAQPRAAQRETALRAFAEEPAVSDAATSARKRLMRVLRREVRRVRRAEAALDGSTAAYHELRKTGRRLRYVADAVAHAVPDMFGGDVEDLAEAGETVHDVLGDHRDLLLFAERVALARARAARDDEPVQAYDAIITDAEEAARDRLGDLDAALARVVSAASWL